MISSSITSSSRIEGNSYIGKVRALVLALAEDQVDSDFYSEQIRKLNQEKRDLEYQNAMIGKYTIDHNGRMSEK